MKKLCMLLVVLVYIYHDARFRKGYIVEKIGNRIRKLACSNNEHSYDELT